jgi:hypothetical protein
MKATLSECLFSHLKFLLELPPETDFDRGYLSAILEFTEAKRDTPEWKAAYVLVHPKLETMDDPPEKSEAAYDFASESDCSVCSKWPEKHREWRRLRIDKIPIPGLKPVCKRCFVSFWRNIGFPLSDEDGEEAERLLLKQEEGTKHLSGIVVETSCQVAVIALTGAFAVGAIAGLIMGLIIGRR